MFQAAEASGSEEEAPAEHEGQEEGEIVAPQTPADKKAQRLAARRAAIKAADDELKVRRDPINPQAQWVLTEQL